MVCSTCGITVLSTITFIFSVSQKVISTVFAILRDNWLALNQKVEFISCFNMNSKNLSRWLHNKLVSSANRIIRPYKGSRCMSLQKVKNSNGPRQLPWAVPYVISYKFEYVTLFKLVVIFATRLLFCK